jgi:hypothetical protein
MDDFKSELEIDKFKLDEEWVKQSGLYLKYAELATEASKTLEEKKLLLEVKAASRYSSIKAGTEKSGIKTTEASLKNMVDANDEIISIKEEVIKAEYNYKMLQKIEMSFNMRKSALENLVFLYTKSYYAEPSAGIKNNTDMKTSFAHKKQQESLKSSLNKGD